MVAGLLLLAFAYLAVGQAAANRNGAQTAADAAALAAAMDTRDELSDEWVESVLDPTKWQAIFDGDGVPYDGCGRAVQLAVQNDATAYCGQAAGLLPGYTVEVETNKAVGDSIVPGTETMHSVETSTAVIEPLCEPPGEGAGDGALPQLSCKDNKNWDLDPDDPTTFPEPEDLFDVHLVDGPANDE
ncbi:hypothetical protein M2271_002619 [Streptomyces sp. LBL]|nr:hypothetical protein [Streptomyces sp. LBL]